MTALLTSAIEAHVRSFSVGTLLHRVRPLDHGEDWLLEFSDDGGETLYRLETSRDHVDGVLNTLTKEGILRDLREQRDEQPR